MVTLWLVRWFGMDYKQAVAHTLVLVGLIWNATGAVTLGLVTPLAWVWLPALLLGSLLGGYLGAVLARRGHNRAIKRLFEVVTVLVGLALLIDAVWLYTASATQSLAFAEASAKGGRVCCGHIVESLVRTTFPPN